MAKPYGIQHSEWYQELRVHAEKYRFIFGLTDPAENPVGELLRIARLIDTLTVPAEQQSDIAEFKRIIDDIAVNLPEIEKMAPEHRKAPFRRLKPIIRYLQREHQYVVRGQYTLTGIVAGLAGGTVTGFAVGMLLGSLTVVPPLGMVAGAAAGFAFGSMMDARASRENRVI